MIVALESPPPPERTSGTSVGLHTREGIYNNHNEGNNKRRHEYVGYSQPGFDTDFSSLERDGLVRSGTFYHPGEGRAPLVDYTQQKRTRFQSSVHQERQSEGPHFTRNTETLLKALKALFPRMSDESIAHVLEECGDDVDAAIRRLNNLQLSTPSCSKEPEGKSQSRSEPLQHSTVAVKAEWVDALVEQMSVAKNVDDAKERATQVLQSALVSSQQELMEHVDAVQKENAILKRAVGIQNTKIHEMMEERKNIDHIVSEVHQLKDKCHALEMHNYSLQLHLKQATSSQQDGCRTPGGGPSNPDVF
jgi:DNA repair exonuclease SbcCD ATPase subunit